MKVNLVIDYGDTLQWVIDRDEATEIINRWLDWISGHPEGSRHVLDFLNTNTTSHPATTSRTLIPYDAIRMILMTEIIMPGGDA